MKEETIEKQLFEAVQKIHTDKEQKAWIIESLKQVNNQKEEFQKETIEQLQMQNKRLLERLNKLYIDKLDGNISVEFWQVKHNEWNA